MINKYILIIAHSLLCFGTQRRLSKNYFRRAATTFCSRPNFQQQHRMATFESDSIVPSSPLVPIMVNDELIKGCIYLLPFSNNSSSSGEKTFTFYTELDSIVKNLKILSPEEKDAFVKKHKIECGVFPVCSLVLERSLFHPQGGGQASDSGIIELIPSDVAHPLLFQVVFVQKGSSGFIDHFGYFRNLEDPSLIEAIISSPASPTAGYSSCRIAARLKLDAEKRQLHTRIHSAGHALDAAVERCAGNYGLKMLPAKGYHFTDGPYVEYQLVEGDGGVLEPSEQMLKTFLGDLNESMKAIIQEDIPTEISIEASEGYDGFTRTVNLAGVSCPCGGLYLHPVLRCANNYNCFEL